jgi:hypothetical protein
MADAALWPQIITIADTNTTSSYLFMSPKVSVGYPVILEPIRFTGTPPLAAFLPIAVEKALDGFVVTVGAAPGVGNSVTFKLGIAL